MKAKKIRRGSKTLLHKVLEKLNEECKAYAYAALWRDFPIKELIKPLVTFSIQGNELVMNVNVKRDSFRCGFVESVEKYRKSFGYNYSFDISAKAEIECRFHILGEKNREIAKYILTLNNLPSSHWAFRDLVYVIYYLGFSL